MISGAIVNGIVFLILFLDCTLLVYGNTTGFCILILYPATLPDLFISSNCVCVCMCMYSLGISIYKIMSSANKDSFTSSFPVWRPLFLPDCLG